MQVTVYDYGDCLLVMEIAGLNNRTMIKGNPKPQTKVANEFYTTEGVLTSGEFTPRCRQEPVARRGGQDVGGE